MATKDQIVNATGNATGNPTVNATGNATGNATVNATWNATGNATGNACTGMASVKGDYKCSTALCTALHNFTTLELILSVICVILLASVIIGIILKYRRIKRHHIKRETVTSESNVEFQDGFFSNDNVSHMNLSLEIEPLASAENAPIVTQSVSTQTDDETTVQCICDIHGAMEGTSSGVAHKYSTDIKKRRYMPLKRGSKAFIAFYTKLRDKNKTDVDPITPHVDYSTWLSEGVATDEQHSSNRNSTTQEYTEIDIDFVKNRTSTGEDYQCIDSDNDFEYFSMLSLPPDCDGNSLVDPPDYLDILPSISIVKPSGDGNSLVDPPDYLDILPSISIVKPSGDDQEYLEPVDGHTLPPFPVSSKESTRYDSELPDPPTYLGSPEQHLGSEDAEIRNSLPSLENAIEQTEGKKISVSSENHLINSATQLPFVASTSLLKSVDHDEILVPDGTNVYDCVSSDYTLPNEYKHENTKDVIKQFISSIVNNDESTLQPRDHDDQENSSQVDTHQVFPFHKHATIPREYSVRHSNNTTLGNERKKRAATFDEATPKREDITKVSSPLMNSLEQMLQEHCKNQNVSPKNKVEVDYEQPPDDYETMESSDNENKKDENENNLVLRPQSSIYEYVEDPLYEDVKREASSCDMMDEQPRKDEVSFAVVTRHLSPYLERKR